MPRRLPASAASLELGRRLRVRREQVGLTQERLAHRVGMSYSSISDLERGLTNPTFHVLLRIAAALNGWDAGEWLAGLTPDDAA